MSPLQQARLAHRDSHRQPVTIPAKTSATHTPGPWYIRFDDPEKVSAGGTGIAVMSGHSRDASERQANARLIAAAPALLALAQRWMTWANGPVVPIAIRMQLQEDTRKVIESL